jgi:hypothetical protein
MPDYVEPRPNEQMIGISEDDLGFQLMQFPRVFRLDGSLGPDRHERRRLDHAVAGGQPAAPGSIPCLVE